LRLIYPNLSFVHILVSKKITDQEHQQGNPRCYYALAADGDTRSVLLRGTLADSPIEALEFLLEKTIDMASGLLLQPKKKHSVAAAGPSLQDSGGKSKKTIRSARWKSNLHQEKKNADKAKEQAAERDSRFLARTQRQNRLEDAVRRPASSCPKLSTKIQRLQQQDNDKSHVASDSKKRLVKKQQQNNGRLHVPSGSEKLSRQEKREKREKRKQYKQRRQLKQRKQCKQQ